MTEINIEFIILGEADVYIYVDVLIVKLPNLFPLIFSLIAVELLTW